MFNPYIIAFIAALFSAAHFITTKYLFRNLIENFFVFFVFFNLITGILVLLIWLFIPIDIPSGITLFWLLLATLSCFVGFIYQYVAFLKGDISITGPLMGLKIPFVALFSSVFLKEYYKPLVYVSVLLCMVSVGLLSRENTPSHEKFSKRILPVVLMVLATLHFAGSDVMSKKALAGIDSLNFTVWFLVLIGVFSLILLPFIPLQNLAANCSLKKLLWVLIAGIFCLGGTTFFFLAIQRGNKVTIPNIIVSTRGIMVIIITFFLSHLMHSGILEFQSKKTYLIRITGAILMTVAVILVLL